MKDRSQNKWLLFILSIQVPCVIGQRTQWQWHRPGFGEKRSPLLILLGSSGKISWDLFHATGWHTALCLWNKSTEKKKPTWIRSKIIIQSQHKEAGWVPLATTEGEKRIPISLLAPLFSGHTPLDCCGSSILSQAQFPHEGAHSTSSPLVLSCVNSAILCYSSAKSSHKSHCAAYYSLCFHVTWN